MIYHGFTCQKRVLSGESLHCERLRAPRPASGHGHLHDAPEQVGIRNHQKGTKLSISIFCRAPCRERADEARTHGHDPTMCVHHDPPHAPPSHVARLPSCLPGRPGGHPAMWPAYAAYMTRPQSRFSSLSGLMHVWMAQSVQRAIYHPEGTWMEGARICLEGTHGLLL